MSENLLLIKRESIESLADAIREKGGMTEMLTKYVTLDRNGQEANFIIPAGITAIDGPLLYGRFISSIEIPDTVTVIGTRAFIYQKLLESADFLHEGITKIGDLAFYGCSALKEVNLPETVIELGEKAFASVPSTTYIDSCIVVKPSVLETVYIRGSIENAGKAVFSNQKSLKNVIVAGNLPISANMFDNCKSLESVEMTSTSGEIGASAFHNCYNLALTSIPESVTSIGNYAFHNCYNLALTSLPKSLTSISYRAFYNCSNLALTSIPEGVTRIDAQAFANCTSLTTMTLSSSIRKISTNAFSGCTNLTTINVPWAEGEVDRAPWGATNATINYNYTGGQDL